MSSSHYQAELSCRYFLLFGEERRFLGSTRVPEGMDVDDAFPHFFSEMYSDEDYVELSTRIRSGALLIAESELDEKTYWLAYVLEDPDYWYGHKSTLEYFGIAFRPAS